MRSACILLAMAMAAVAGGAAAGPAPIQDGPLQPPAAREHTLFFTTERADIVTHGIVDARVMAPQRTGNAGQVAFASDLDADIPGLPGPERVESITWHTREPLRLDTDLVQAATVVVFLQASVPATADLRVELHAVASDGGRVLLADQRQAVPLQAQSGRVEVELPQRGAVAPAGSVLALTMGVDGLHAGTVLDFDSDAAPSGIAALRLRPADADEDGMPDTLERERNTDLHDAHDPGDGAFDSDGDGVPDAREAALGTDPFLADSDGDGWVDGDEVQAGTDPRNGADRPVDTDGDGLFDAFEARSETSTTSDDSDADGLSDCLEDPDGDNLTNCMEQRWATDPLGADSDGDGVLDGEEVRTGTDPTRHGAPPRGPQPQVAEVALATVFLGAAAALGYVGLARRHRL